MDKTPEKRRQQDNKNESSSQNKGGRPPGNTLEKLPIQEMILKKIIMTGEVDHCYKGFVSAETYRRFLKKNKASWDEKVAHAMEERENYKVLLNPKLERLAIQKLVEMVSSDKASFVELMQFIKMLRGFRGFK